MRPSGSAPDVEVAQAGRAHAVPAAGPVQRALDHQLALAVRRGWGDGRIFADQPVGGGEDVGGRRQDEPVHAVPDAGLDQRETAASILAQVVQRPIHALAHQRQGGKVEHGTPRPAAEGGIDLGRVVHVSLDQRHARRQRRPVALPQIVHHRHLGARPMQRRDHVAAHEARTASHQKTVSHRQLHRLGRLPPSFVCPRGGLRDDASPPIPHGSPPAGSSGGGYRQCDVGGRIGTIGRSIRAASHKITCAGANMARFFTAASP